MEPGPRPSRIRFGAFTADLENREVHREGTRLKLQRQPFEVLAALLDRPGQVVTREELRKLLWQEDVFIDYDRGLNKAVNRLREVLGDNADQPRFIETVPLRGYRFIGLIEREELAVETAAAQLKSKAPIEPEPRKAAFISATPPSVKLASLGLAIALVSLGFYSWRLTQPASIRSIAVLPLANLSGDPAQEFFSDGMTEALIGELAHVSSLHVVSRTSVMRYKNNVQKMLSEIGRELNVEAIVEGTVTKSADKVRITAQLIRARDDRHLWSQSYERNLTDVLTLQREVARAIALEVRVSLRPEERNRFSQSRGVNPEAYQAFLQGNHFLHQNIRGVLKNIEWFRRAIELDSGYADAYVGLAHGLIYAGIYEFRPFAEAYTEARIAAQKALELDGSNAGAHNVLADVKKGLDWDLPGAEQEQRLALQISPNHLFSRLWHAETLSRWDRHDEALAESARAVALDPVSALSHNNRAMLLWRARRYDDAIREAQISLELDPSHLNALWWQGLAYAEKHDFPRSISCLQKSFEMSKAPVLLASLGYVYGLAGEPEKARKAFGELEALSRKRYVSHTNIATVYAGLGNADEAFGWLQKAYEARDGRVHQLTWPYFDRFRGDVRYVDLKRRIGLL